MSTFSLFYCSVRIHVSRIQLDWMPDTTDTYTVQFYEEYRSNSAPRRSKAEMLLPADYRTELLMDGGFSEKEIKVAQEQAADASKKRRETIKRLGAQPIEEKLEKAKKNFSKFSKLAASLR